MAVDCNFYWATVTTTGHLQVRFSPLGAFGKKLITFWFKFGVLHGTRRSVLILLFLATKGLPLGDTALFKPSCAKEIYLSVDLTSGVFPKRYV